MKDLGNHKRVFTENLIQDGTPLYYIIQGEEKHIGVKVSDGIFCDCCKETVTPSMFENHAGYASRRKPYDNIFAQWSYDNISAPELLSLKAIAQQRILVAKCAICSRDVTEKVFDGQTVKICNQCVKEYIAGCLRRQERADVKALPGGELLCCLPCKHINKILEMVVRMEELKISKALYADVTEKSEEGLDINQLIDIHWRLLNGREAIEDTLNLFSEVVSIFHDHINPVNDPTGATLDHIQAMVFGRSSDDQDYSGMHCAILLFNSYVVAAAIFRVYGDGTVDIPLVATKGEYETTGLKQTFLNCTKKFFEFLNVNNPDLLDAGMNHTGIIDFSSRN